MKIWKMLLCLAAMGLPVIAHAQVQLQTAQSINGGDANDQEASAAPQVPQSTRPFFSGQSNPRIEQPAGTPSNVPVPEAPPIPSAQSTLTDESGTRVFGQSLFQGQFAQQSFKGFNPDYLISVGDQIDVKLWGAVDAQLLLPVDAQGNIFIPRVGPVPVMNVPNGQLNEAVKRKVRTVYRQEVGVYATLAAAVPVKVFVSGFVKRPGLYAGYASDSLLNFLDRAGGIDPVSGSYIDVRVLRNGKEIATVNLYDFLTRGSLAQQQLRDGDSVFVGPIGATAIVDGLVATPAQYEFQEGASLSSLLSMAGISGKATNVSVTRSQGPKREVSYLKVGDPALDGPVVTGDYIEVSADRLVGQIAVTLEGEHEGAGQYVLPYEATMADLLEQVKFTAQSNRVSLQLFRQSIAERQKQVLNEMLRRLEQAVLSARSTTREESELRTREAELVLKFIDRSRNVQPKGQVVLPEGFDPATIALEDGDVVRIPRNSQLVQVHGEVYLPNAFVWRKGYHVNDYLNQAGGMLQKSSGERVLLIRPSGEISSEEGRGFIMSSRVQPGDEIMVLPGVDPKRFQFGKDIVQVMYQIAIAAGVLARL
tara:strand:- start:1974 stop:3749 length:1776 start_codon:yes stop_codon:yes gene_type:complete